MTYPPFRRLGVAAAGKALLVAYAFYVLRRPVKVRASSPTLGATCPDLQDLVIA